jgi:hypothetical protein
MYMNKKQGHAGVRTQSQEQEILIDKIMNMLTSSTPYNLTVNFNNFNNSSLVKIYTKGQTTPSISITVNSGQCRSSKINSVADVKNLMMAPYG